jgi:hypothetical protein
MSDELTDATVHCPWCSAVLPDENAATCPSCGATLTSATGVEPDIRGVTTLDHEAILRARSETARPRNRLLSFITGEVAVSATDDPAAAASLAPPADEVRREMLRLQLEAERASLEAESIAIKADTVVEQGIDLTSLGGDEDAVETSGTPDAAAPDPEPSSPPADTGPAPAAPESPFGAPPRP